MKLIPKKRVDNEASEKQTIQMKKIVCFLSPRSHEIREKQAVALWFLHITIVFTQSMFIIFTLTAVS